MITPYTCICCGYTTEHKTRMQLHLFKKKKPCPKSHNNVELTDEIKNIILRDHIYRQPPPPPPPPPPPSLVQHISNTNHYNNTVNALVTNMDTYDKLSKYLTHQNTPLIEFGNSIENTFVDKIEVLKQKHTDDTYGAYDGMILDKDDLLEVINQVSSLAQDHSENLNVVYDKKFNRLKLFDMGKWNEVILLQGIATMLAKIQESYFNVYECYLIRKIELSSLSMQDKAIIRDQLIEYYKFIGCFEIDPYVKEKNETEIIYNDDDKRYDSYAEFTDENTEMPIRYTNLFYRVCGETKTSELNKIKKSVIDLIKRNCLKNVDELNKRVVDLFSMNEEFKHIIMPSSC